MTPLHKQCLLGERLSGELLLDCHAHIGRHADYIIPRNQPEELAEEMRRLNVRGAFVFQFTGVQTGEVAYGNDVIADSCCRVPRRFMGLTMVNPCFECDVMPELERCRGLGFAGVKLITSYQGYPDDGPLFEAICGFAHEHHTPILNHWWGSKLEEWLQRFPQAQFITGHWDPGRAELVRRYDNLWVCTCLPIAHESFEIGMRDLRPDRVMWGSDMSDLQFGVGLGPILLARVDEEVKRRVIGLNMLELLETCGIPAPDAWDP
ncbi:MAG: amidohydrolase family protein [Armatimonadetes bacterium]|nr:amidohydrolase family protein [Armatimonadota bacterium]